MKYSHEKTTWKDGTMASLSLPVWEEAKPKLAIAELEMHLADARKHLDAIGGAHVVTSEMLIERSEDLKERSSWDLGPIHHLAAVARTDELDRITKTAGEITAAFDAEYLQRKDVYDAHKKFAASPAYAALGQTEKRIIDRSIEDFERGGVALPVDKKARVMEIKERLATLMHEFDSNVTSATNAWEQHVPLEDAAMLAGIPDALKEGMAERAKEKNLSGWMLSIKPGEFLAVLSTAANSELRRMLFEANIVRASDLASGPEGTWDNTKLMPEILALRHELAGILGKENFSEFILSDKMVTSVSDVFDFLWSLAHRGHARAHDDAADLLAFAHDELKMEKVEIWDMAYVRDQMSSVRYGVSQEVTREYFPESKVMSGLFGLIERLYGYRFVHDPRASVWHPSVRFYRMFDKDGELRGGLYTDLYSRDGKRGGAWMDVVTNRRRKPFGSVQLPVAYLNANFLAPSGGKEGYVTHDDIITIFHEMGHDLHLLSTEAEYISSGMEEVEWDGIELPSQFMENFAWDAEILKAMSAHRDTGAVIPDDLIAKLIASRYFCAALDAARQLELALTDLTLHAAYAPASPDDPFRVMSRVRAMVRVLPVHPMDRMLASFSHIFAGGYASLYHSYKRAESLSADAFEAFVESGTIVNPEVAERFRKEILAPGSSRSMMESFKAFRGREPSIDALLRATGLMPE